MARACVQGLLRSKRRRFAFALLSPPKGPFRTKNSTESKFTTARENATARAKRYGECSEVLAFLGERGRKTVQIVKNYGGSKILRIRAPYYFLVRKGPLGTKSKGLQT